MNATTDEAGTQSVPIDIKNTVYGRMSEMPPSSRRAAAMTDASASAMGPRRAGALGRRSNLGVTLPVGDRYVGGASDTVHDAGPPPRWAVRWQNLAGYRKPSTSSPTSMTTATGEES